MSELTRLSQAVAVSVLAERMRRLGGRATMQRARCVWEKTRPLPSSASLQQLLSVAGSEQRHLGSGSYGCVYAGMWLGRPAAFKFVAFVPTSSLGTCSPLDEHLLNAEFAAVGAAWAPLALLNKSAASGRGLSVRFAKGARRNVAVLVQQLLPETLDVLLRRRRVDDRALGEALVKLLRLAHDSGLVHNDAKCNNIGAVHSPAGTDLRFIDFGRALSRARLVPAIGQCNADRALQLATLEDCNRLAGSVGRAGYKQAELALRSFASDIAGAAQTRNVEADKAELRELLRHSPGRPAP